MSRVDCFNAFVHSAQWARQTPMRKSHVRCTWLVWLYVAVLLATWLLIYCGGDRWWFPTVMLFGPRWIYALPLVVVVPIAMLVRRCKVWVPFLAALVIVLGPIMGLCLPWTRLVVADRPTIRMLTCNVQGNHVDEDALVALIDEIGVELVALQECAPTLHFDWPVGWHVHRAGPLIVASRYPIRNAERSLRHHPPNRWPPLNAVRCVVEFPGRQVNFCSVHLRSPRQGLQLVIDRWTLVSPSKSQALVAEIDYRGQESKELADWLSDFSESMIIAGDFNMPSDSAIIRRIWGTYSDAFSTSGLGFGYTKQSSIRGWQYGARIDHILTGPGWRCRQCWVGPDIGSDHRPLIADVYRNGPPCKQNSHTPDGGVRAG